MGLFSRNKPASGSGSRSRSSMSSEAQAAELRGRARRRLIGALALVVAAIIVVPALFDNSPSSDATPDTLVVVPATIPPIPEPDTNIAVANTPVDPEIPMAELAGSVSDPLDETAAQPQPATPDPAPPTESQPTPEPEPAPATPATPPQKKPEPKPTEKPAPDRTDDGSVAIALLEGRAPTQSTPRASSTGSFTLQIAAYTTDKDAKSRKDQLVSAGVTNAYVEHATVNSKDTYRLRVGPFPSRDAAQAAQARLRALGYDNSFISAK